MDSSRNTCRHHDVRLFDGVRTCLSCGLTLFGREPAPSMAETYGADEYLYQPLNYVFGQEIRLVVLYPGTATDDIHCDIVHVDLLDNPVYEALSYTWATEDGDTSLSKKIFCNGRHLKATPNCVAALRRLRRRSAGKPIWVDAICIQQNNVAERNHQVSLMSLIYSRAEQVVIYLGEGHPAIDALLQHLSGQRHFNLSLERYASRANKQNLDSKIQIDPATIHQGIQAFLRRRYFDRVWVIQEVALSKSAVLIFGDNIISWTSYTIRTVIELYASRNMAVPGVLQWVPSKEKEMNLVEMLCKARNCSASDPRDKVFAVLSLAVEELRDAVPVDYRKTPLEVFTHVAKVAMAKDNNLEILMHTAPMTFVSSHQSLPSPSWVPRWDIKLHHKPLQRQFSVTEVEILSSRDFLAHVPQMPSIEMPRNFWSPDERYETSVEALLIPEPKARGKSDPITQGYWSSEDTWLTNLSLWANNLRHLSISNLGDDSDTLKQPGGSVPSQIPNHNYFRFELRRGDTVLKVRAHRLDTIRALPGRAKNVGHAHYVRNYRNPPPAFGCRTGCEHCPKDWPDDEDRMPILKSRFIDQFEAARDGRDIFEGQSSMGFAGNNTNPGDTVWALDTATIPYVLRQVDNHYLLVSDCYLFGALRGYHPCSRCGRGVRPWPIKTEIIEIW